MRIEKDKYRLGGRHSTVGGEGEGTPMTGEECMSNGTAPTGVVQTHQMAATTIFVDIQSVLKDRAVKYWMATTLRTSSLFCTPVFSPRA